MMRRGAATACVAVAALGVCCALIGGDGGPQPPADAEPSCWLEHEGVRYAVFPDGNAYTRRGEGWRFAARVYDPAWRGRLVERDGALHKRGPDGELYRLRRAFACDLDRYADLRALIGVGEDRAGFTSVTLQSPAAPTVRDYVALRQRILRGEAGFVDNRVEPSTTRARGGRGRSLRCLSVAPTGSMVCSKASLSTELLAFRQGDHVWYRAWYWLEPGDAGFVTLVDLEATAFDEHAGIRLVLRGGRHLACELKFAGKPMFAQEGEAVVFPRGRWVRVDWALALAAAPQGQRAGRVRVWQDGRLLLDRRGQTLPLPDAIYDSLEVGLSATAGPETAELFLDDLAIADRRLADSPAE